MKANLTLSLFLFVAFFSLPAFGFEKEVPLPQAKVPALKVKTLDGKVWDIAKQNPKMFTMVIFYRGYHCPICLKYLQEIDTKLPEFEEQGVNVIAISMDTFERAEKTRQEMKIKNLTIGYGMSLDTALKWGLYISKGVLKNEPEQFSEPGLFLVRPDGTLYASSVQTMPFTRPSLDELLAGIKFIKEKKYPARGESCVNCQH
jgi:peroxiredoxin